VLLVDGDLRRADLHRCLDLPTNEGLSTALIGKDPSAFYIPHPDLPGLVILPAGPRPPKPPDLLDSDRMRELIASWRQAFDHIIIDAPPIIGMSDAVILATMVDTVVLVVRAQQSHRHDLLRAQEMLASVDAKVGGAVINDFPMDCHLPYGYDPSLYRGYFESAKGRNGRH
jgi:capsular exopolysaccharide synthesis family protein